MAAIAEVRAVDDDPEERDARRVVEGVHAQYGQQLFGFVRRLGLGDEEAREVTQEVLLRLWRACLGPEVIDRPVAWSFRTAYRLAMDRHRFQRRWLAFIGRLSSAKAITNDNREDLLAVWTEVDRLPERQRQVLYLRYRADLAFEDIGRILAIDTSSARSNASRGIASLRERLAGRED